MTMRLSPELEQRLTALAKARHRDPQAVLDDLVSAAEDEDAAFVGEVEAGLTDLDAGREVPHEEAIERLRRAAGGEIPGSRGR